MRLFPRLKRFAAVVAAVTLTIPLLAITYGVEDTSNIFSNVGAMVVRKGAGDVFQLCSGTLIAPNVFLTASHCTAYFNSVLVPLGYTAYVTFDEAVTNSSTLIPVSAVVVNPNYNQAQSDSGDIGALVLSTAYPGSTAATLPTLGLLDQLSQKNGLHDTGFVAVGYGLQQRVNGGGPPTFGELQVRMYAVSTFLALNPGYIRLSQNPSTGNGGTCYGDSGGPNFLSMSGSYLLAAITITGDTACRATNVDYRLDTASARQFLQYVNTTFGTSIPIP